MGWLFLAVLAATLDPVHQTLLRVGVDRPAPDLPLLRSWLVHVVLLFPTTFCCFRRHDFRLNRFCRSRPDLGPKRSRSQRHSKTHQKKQTDLDFPAHQPPSRGHLTPAITMSDISRKWHRKYPSRMPVEVMITETALRRSSNPPFPMATRVLRQVSGEIIVAKHRATSD
uniref:Uncharacterized protein n=1 Tax=Magnetospirillum gryphiswaldense TaxID=55518 RepID=A4U255_9PROT|nr:hypothetical protein MGR_0681 [Magnetospirillum gryphiswaldense MSR-1]